MAKAHDSQHRLNKSTERLEVADAWLRGNVDVLRCMDRETRIVAALGLLICNAEGCFSQAELSSALADSDAVSAAELLVSTVIR